MADTDLAVADFKSDDEPGIAIAAISELLRDIPYLRSALATAAPAASLHTSADLEAACRHVTILREIKDVFQPSLLNVDDAILEEASSALSSPFCWLLVLLSSSKKSAITAVQACLRAPINRPAIFRALQAWRNLPAEWRTALRSLPDSSAPRLYDAIARFPKAWRDLHRVYPVGLPADLDDCIFTLQSMDREKLAAHRVRRLRDVERELRDVHLATFIELIGDQRLAPAHWEPAFDRSWLLSHLDRVMPALATFNGRLHDKVVERFCEADQMRIELARHRILRTVAERHIETTRAFPKQQSALDLQIQKQRGNKPIRDMFTEAPQALAGICPCVMASPLSVSQFLPCEPLFDVVIFDEASQVAPETAITAILRGRRLVVAGDEHQLPPTSFFTAISEEDDDADEDSPIVGMESILDTVKPFFKPLGLRVHYRSQDERLIAFSNHHIYDDRLVTFAGSGKDGAAVSHVLVPPSNTEGDEKSSAAEVQKVVELVLEHAERRPTESLGVICMNIKHASRVQLALDQARRERPDLDVFFHESSLDTFFVKNLERVQGDERDAIILTIGYARTKTGAVSHNFGPINVTGGERRLNVAITRAKKRITVVSSFRSNDLDPQRLKSKGAQLFGAYLKYAESGGEDLGRDRPHEEVALNDFEADIKTTLERQVGMSIVPQYGVGEFRIDLAVQHPDEPGRFVMAIECDGATYHSSPTARMRDRLRQQILEGLGWRFLRIWSTDWFHDRASEIARAERAYREALLAADDDSYRGHLGESTLAPNLPALAETEGFSKRIGKAPVSGPYRSINDVQERTLQDLLAWIVSDERLRTDDELIAEAVAHLGFERRGKSIVARLENAISRFRSQQLR